MAGSRKNFIHPGRFALLRERFQLDWLRPTPPQRMKQMSELMPDALKALGVVNADPLSRLKRAWPSVAGEDLARRCSPTALNNATLILNVRNSIDLMELRPLVSSLLLHKARLVLGETEVRQVRLMIGAVD